jgi:uncharacterized protein YndB with AHSA1/START domain
MAKKKQITVQVLIDEPIKKVWEAYTNPKHIVKWNFASSDWRCPSAESDLRVGGRFEARMESKNGDEGFDFGGTYTKVVPLKQIAYTMDGKDNRKATVEFEKVWESTNIKVSFDPEKQNSIEMQREGWQAILENFKNYTEAFKG